MTNEELKRIREEKKQGKGEFAKSLGVTPMVYGRYESGTLKIPENIEAAVKEMVEKTSDKVVAVEIEVKKKTRSAGRKVKEAVEKAVNSDEIVAAEIEVKKKARGTARKAKDAVEKATDAAVATEAEVKKKARSTTRKAKETVKETVKAVAKTAVLIQSQLGGTITPEEVLRRIPEGCDRVYIKPEENKAYWAKGDESGAVELW